jgi:trk system potassium uptake protein TrkH
MNYSLIFRLLSVILISLALAFGLCLGISFAFASQGTEETAKTGFLFSIAISSVLAAFFYYLGKGGSSKIFRKEALCLIGVGWFLASVIGSLPYLFIVPNFGIMNAFFESTSGLTTTGASILTDIESLPKGLLFWRSLSQWIGGMGVVVFFVAVLGFLGAGAKILYSNEASGSTSDFEEGRVQSAVSHLLWLYIGLSTVCAILYRIGGMNWYDAFCHMFATVATGGFSTYNASFAAFQSPFLQWTSIAFMILCGTSFLLLWQVLNGRISKLKRNTEFLAYISLMTGVTFIIALFLMRENGWNNWSEQLRASAFQVTSIITTTGFVTEDYVLWPSFPHVLLLSLMLIGGCSASTSGGIKIIRLVVAFRVCLHSIERTFRTRVVRRISVNGRTLNEGTAQETTVYIAMIGFLCLCSIPIVSVSEPNFSPETSLSAVIACLFNIGPGFGEIGPTLNYSHLHDHTKFVLSFLMIAGRVELYAILVLFSPSLWRRFT